MCHAFAVVALLVRFSWSIIMAVMAEHVVAPCWWERRKILQRVIVSESFVHTHRAQVLKCYLHTRCANAIASQSRRRRRRAPNDLCKCPDGRDTNINDGVCVRAQVCVQMFECLCASINSESQTNSRLTPRPNTNAVLATWFSVCDASIRNASEQENRRLVHDCTLTALRSMHTFVLAQLRLQSVLVYAIACAALACYIHRLRRG